MKNKNKSDVTEKKKVVLVDDHPVMREGLAKLINQEASLVVVGEANGYKDALAVVAQTAPDLVIADLCLLDRDGLSLLKELADRFSTLPVLILSMHDETIYAERVLRAGGRGYIMKSESGDSIREAIHRVLAGEVYLSPAMAQTVLRKVGHVPQSGNCSSVDQLSDRELQVYERLGQGFGVSDIATQLHLSRKTIETYCANIRNKLNIADAGELRRRAILFMQSRLPGN